MRWTLGTIMTSSIGGAGIDADAQAFLTATGISDSTITSAIDTLVKAAKANGWWTLCNAIYPFVGATATTCKYNLKDPRDLDAAFRLVFAGAGSYTSAGYVLNGSSAYGDTKLVPNTTLSQNSTHFSMFSTAATSNNGGSGVAGDNATKPYMEMYFDGVSPNQRIFYAVNSIADDLLTTGVTHSGHHILTRGGAASVTYYHNGASADTSTVASTTPGSQSMFVGSHNTAATPGTPTQFDNGTYQFFTIGANISSGIATSMYNDIVTLNTALSR